MSDDPSAGPERRDGFTFRAARLALDFGATLARRSRAEPTELLAQPKDLARWLRAAGLAPVLLRPTARELAEAWALREALYRLGLAAAGGAALGEADRGLVNRWAAKPAPAPQLVGAAAGTGPAWTRGNVAGCLAAVARDGVALLSGPLADRVRKCAGCTILFVDMSRAGTRRWCSMAACGNRAKVKAFRRRASAAQEGGATGA